MVCTISRSGLQTCSPVAEGGKEEEEEVEEVQQTELWLRCGILGAFLSYWRVSD